MAVPVAAIARRRVAAHFLSEGATDKLSAIAYEPGRLVQRRALKRMKAAGIVRAGAPGTWWLDTVRFEEAQVQRRTRASFGLVLLAIVAAAAFFAGRGF